ncbi:MAG: glycosyltransferase family 39 protein [Planctomycetota bacterium]|nr:glycosyltransferase family 39 protein [Planctomycetota bacterium]MDA1140418.1 glycosyltransferase family 39 protein [Planctomycetota bacterium]
MTSISNEEPVPAGKPHDTDTEPEGSLLRGISTKQAAFGLLILCGVMYFPWLGERDLWAPDEPRFTLVSREMMETGDYVVPRRNGMEYVKKPPLLFWSVALLGKLNGEVTEGVARIPSAVAATGLVMATFACGVSQLGNRAGLLAALMVMTAFKTWWNARYVQTDMLFACFSATSVMLIYLAYMNPKKAWNYAMPGFVCVGTAFLVKGPLACVLVFWGLGPLMILRQLKLKEFPGLRRWMPFLVGVVICLAIPAPWYYLVGKEVGGVEFAQKNFIYENVTRFLAAYDHANPFYHYLILLPGDFFPWFFLLPPSLCFVWRQRAEDENRWFGWFLLLWVGLSFVFFSTSQSKQGKYLLPLYPGMCLAIGWWVDSVIEVKEGRSRTARGAFGICHSVLLLICLTVVAINLRPELTGKAAEYKKFFRLILVPGVLGIIGTILGLFILNRNIEKSLLVLAATVGFILMHTSAVLLPALDEVKSAKDICLRAKQLVGPADRVGFAGSWSSNNTYIFYMNRRLDEFEGGPKEVSDWMTDYAAGGRAFLFIRQVRYETLTDTAKQLWHLVHEERVGSKIMMLLCNEELAKD